MEQNSEIEQAQGIFNKQSGDKNTKREDEIPSVHEKKQFKDPFKLQAEEVAERSKRPLPSLESLTNDSVLESTAASVNNSGAAAKNVQADLDDNEKFTDAEVEIAEQMIFKGYAEVDESMPRFPDHKFTICSTSAEEIAIVEEIIFDTLKKAENEDGSVNLPQSKVSALRNGLFVAVSYRGMDFKELSEDSSCQLNTIKKAIIRVTDLEDAGKLDESVALKDSLKKRLLQRTTLVNRLATPIIDFLSDAKYKFDSKMLKIISSGDIVPKS